MNKVTVIRILKYEGDEATVRKAIQMSKTLGEHVCSSGPDRQLILTIAEHYNDLPPLIEIADADVDKALEPK